MIYIYIYMYYHTQAQPEPSTPETYQSPVWAGPNRAGSGRLTPSDSATWA